jgi:hypothetical protein
MIHIDDSKVFGPYQRAYARWTFPGSQEGCDLRENIPAVEGAGSRALAQGLK